VLLSISLLVPLCSKICGCRTLDSDANTPLEPFVKLFLEQASDHDLHSKGDTCGPTTDNKVPAKETITEVQPKAPEVKAIDVADLVDKQQ
ncbi:unnamed protein product, partial [Soboliphyme baturini]|uniref:Secreted protein n=1 Tax=Soboliphyme baturini TaxID=241478 RepID=A0A183I8X6_9BILA